VTDPKQRFIEIEKPKKKKIHSSLAQEKKEETKRRQTPPSPQFQTLLPSMPET
jgi:hypothetical protein